MKTGFLKANYKLQQIYWKLFLPQRKQWINDPEWVIRDLQ